MTQRAPEQPGGTCTCLCTGVAPTWTRARRFFWTVPEDGKSCLGGVCETATPAAAQRAHARRESLPGITGLSVGGEGVGVGGKVDGVERKRPLNVSNCDL